MRWIQLIGVWSLALVASAQESPVSGGLFASVRPDATIVIKKHATGADMVEVTLLNPKYPPELLKERILHLGKLLNSEPRGLVAGRYPMGATDDPKLVFVKATFAIDGLVSTNPPRLRIQEILKAFTGDPEPFTIRGYSLVFDNLAPSPKYVQTFRGEGVLAEARTLQRPMTGLEYRIAVEVDRPEDIVFPDQVPERNSAPPPSQPESRSNVVLWAAIGVAALAAGSLVYLAVLRSGAKSASNNR